MWGFMVWGFDGLVFREKQDVFIMLVCSILMGAKNGFWEFRTIESYMVRPPTKTLHLKWGAGFLGFLTFIKGLSWEVLQGSTHHFG